LTNDLFKRIGAAATRFGKSVYGLPAQKAIVETRKLVGFSLLGADYVLPLNIGTTAAQLSLPEWVMTAREAAKRSKNLAARCGFKILLNALCRPCLKP
jgi:hypothetical protein